MRYHRGETLTVALRLRGDFDPAGVGFALRVPVGVGRSVDFDFQASGGVLSVTLAPDDMAPIPAGRHLAELWGEWADGRRMLGCVSLDVIAGCGCHDA